MAPLQTPTNTIPKGGYGEGWIGGYSSSEYSSKNQSVYQVKNTCLIASCIPKAQVPQ